MTDHTEFATTQPSGPLARLDEARTQRWHQNGEALLTFENVRSWLNAAGLVLFAPRPQIAAPAPTFVEAVLGARTPEPTLQQTEEARALLSRLVAEGAAVPLNLLGASVGETPDYIASAGIFSYIFTLRGDKGWKQPPSASGTTRVSQLAVHAYEIIARSGARSAGELTQELGNGVTESAVLRAINELWTNLRVLPMPQQDGRPTMWELATTRYIKQIKAGANAGQPSALSALTSLYLSQVIVATEEEIEIFLSPLASRSRTRDVLHALTSARQLETVAIEGRTMLHIGGESPAFLNEQPLALAAGAEEDETGSEAAEGEEATEGEETGERIKRFVPKTRKPGSGPLAKGAPVKRAAKSFDRPGRKTFGPGAGDRDRERRPFQRDRAAAPPAGEAPRFDRPWSEERPRRSRPAEGAGDERPSRPERRTAGSADRRGGDRPFRTDRTDRSDRAGRPERPARSFGGDRQDRSERPSRPFGAGRPTRAAGGDRPTRSFGSDRPARPFDSDRPARPYSSDRQGRPERPGRPDRPFRTDRPARPYRAEGGDRPERADRRSSSERPSRGAGAAGWKPAFRDKNRPARGDFREQTGRPPREGGFERKPRRDDSGERPARFSEAPGGAKRPFSRDREGAPQGERPARPFRRFDEARPGGKRPYERRTGPAGSGERPRGNFRPRPEGGRGGPAPRGNRSPQGDRPYRGKGTSGSKPGGRTFKRKEDESA